MKLALSAFLVACASLVIALGALPVIGQAQAPGTVRGAVTDSATGQPVRGVLVAINCPSCYGRHPTDSAGRYAVAQVTPGSWRLEAHCPSRAYVGAEIAQRTVAVSAGAETVVNIVVPPGRCAEPPYAETAGIFRGYWTPGFESSAFYPCADSTLGVAAPLLPGKRLFMPYAWATLLPAARGRQIAWPKNAPLDGWNNPTYFVIWHGVLKGPGSYGHMGVSAFSMVVDSIVDVSVRGPGNCRTR